MNIWTAIFRRQEVRPEPARPHPAVDAIANLIRASIQEDQEEHPHGEA